MSDDVRDPAARQSPEMRRAMSRRYLIREEMGRAGAQAAGKLPGLGRLFGMVLREPPEERDERLFNNLWLLLMGRKPKEQERAAGFELVRKAGNPDEKGDAFVDVLWALCQTKDFEELERPGGMLVRGLYLIALDREPTEQERQAALAVLAEAREPAARIAALEGLLTGLFRSSESVLRQTPPSRRRP